MKVWYLVALSQENNTQTKSIKLITMSTPAKKPINLTSFDTINGTIKIGSRVFIKSWDGKHNLSGKEIEPDEPLFTHVTHIQQNEHGTVYFKTKDIIEPIHQTDVYLVDQEKEVAIPDVSVFILDSIEKVFNTSPENDLTAQPCEQFNQIVLANGDVVKIGEMVRVKTEWPSKNQIDGIFKIKTISRPLESHPNNISIFFEDTNTFVHYSNVSKIVEPKYNFTFELSPTTYFKQVSYKEITLKAGETRVKHPKFGEGIVTDIHGRGTKFEFSVHYELGVVHYYGPEIFEKDGWLQPLEIIA